MKTTIAIFSSVAVLLSGYAFARKTRILKHIKSGKGIYIGVDLGGTAIKVGVLARSGKVIADANELIKCRDFESVCDAIIAMCENLLKGINMTWSDVDGMGVVMPGMVDTKSGVTVFVANFPTWPRNAPLAGRIQELCGVRPVIDNDANVALLAEVWQGAARGHKDVVMVTLGTGVGGAILTDGQLVRGENNLGGEIGHMILVINGRPSVNTGVNGIVEEYVSARAVGLRAQDAVDDHPKSMLASVPKSEITCKLVFEAAKKGDAFASAIVEETYELLAILCINVSRVLDPSVILLTGGMIAAGNCLHEGVRRYYLKHNWNLDEPTCHIRFASLSTRAGIVGAAFLGHPDCATI